MFQIAEEQKETVREMFGETPEANIHLILATVANQREWVAELIKQGTDPDQPDIAGTTALMWACTEQNNWDTFELLLSNTKGLDAKNCSDQTALMLSIQNGELQKAMALLKRGASPNTGNLYGESPLCLAMCLGRTSFIEPLVRAGADLQGQDSHGIPHWKRAIHEDQEASLIEWLSAGGDPNSKDSEGTSLLSFAAEAGMMDAVTLVLSRLDQVSVDMIDWETTLSVATQPIIDQLLQWKRAFEFQKKLRKIQPSPLEETEELRKF